MIRAATTFSHEGFELYGRRCIESFIENWPTDVILDVYHEGWRDSYPQAPNVEYHLLDNPELMAFKARHKDNLEAHGLGSKAIGAKANFAWDAVRFSHKVFAYANTALRENIEIAIWLDGDTFTHTKVELEDIKGWLNNKMAGYLGRPWLYTETGFHIFDMTVSQARGFFEDWLLYYKADTVFSLDGWTDCHTYDAARAKMPDALWNNLSPDFKHPHPFINGILGKHMDHMKGPRKQMGSSQPKDLVVKRLEKYWQK